jgi:hypothetical protein
MYSAGILRNGKSTCNAVGVKKSPHGQCRRFNQSQALREAADIIEDFSETPIWGVEVIEESSFAPPLPRIDEVLNASPQRYYAVERFLAFCGGRHSRLGAASPVRILTKDVLMILWKRFLKPVEQLLVIGGEFKPPNSAMPPKPLSSVFVVDLHTGIWRPKESIPVNGLVNACAAVHRRSGDVWVIGGRTGAGVNYDAFVYNAMEREWDVEENVFGDKMVRCFGSIVIVNDILYAIGGTNDETRGIGALAAPDLAFDIYTGEMIALPPRPNAAQFVCTNSCVVANRYLVSEN